MNDHDFLRAIEDATFDAEQFHHREHLRMTWLYLTHHGFALGAQKVHAALTRFAAANGHPEKFHETITRAFTDLVALAIESSATAATSLELLLDAAPRLLERDLLFHFYARATLLSQRAREGFVPPDLMPLSFRHLARGLPDCGACAA